MKKIMLALIAAFAIGSRAMAQFDGSLFTAELTTGAATAGAVATSIATICAGVLVWKKVAKYFGKAG